jgi:hypothetical protein
MEMEERSSRRKTMATEWDGLFTPPLSFYFISGKSQQILAVHYEVEMAGQI